MIFYALISPGYDHPYFSIVRDGCTYSVAFSECDAFDRALAMCVEG